MEGCDRSLVAFLGEIFCGVGISEVPADSDHLGLGFGDELLKGPRIPITGLNEQSRETIHQISIAAGTLFSLGPTVTFMDRYTEGDAGHKTVCEGFLEALSARIDGELDAAEERNLQVHLGVCAHCCEVAERFSAITRMMRVREVGQVPDVAAVVMSRVRPARLGRSGWIRPALGWVAVVIGVQSLGPLFTSNVSGMDVHAARHLGAFALALAVALGYVAWRPHRAFGLLPFAVALVVITIGAAAVDVVIGRSSALAESVHLAEMVGVVLLWMVAGSPGWQRFIEFIENRSPKILRT
jgi:predicted anti-sigma-YlaC factor YlaD